MAQDVPELPDTKLRTSISLPARLVIVADRVVADVSKDRPGFNFSHLVAEALIAYADKHHPGLRDQVMGQIQKSPDLVTGHRWYRAENPTGKKTAQDKFPSDEESILSKKAAADRIQVAKHKARERTRASK